MGSEFDGLGDVASRNCDSLVRIAMAPGVDSLNVAVAAAVLLDRHSTAKQRLKTLDLTRSEYFAN